MGHVQIYIIIFIVSTIILCVQYNDYCKERSKLYISGNYGNNTSLLGIIAAIISASSLGVVAANLFVYLIKGN